MQVPPDENQRQQFIDDIEQTPAALRAAVQGLTPQQVETPYRDGGWTVRQVTHHVPESHMNAYIRFKLALTEDAPTIKPYMEDRWANLPDVQSTPLEVSLSLLDSLHDRWVRLLRSLSPQDWKRTFNHPELGSMPLEKNLALYSWHGRHHVAHITELRKKMGWCILSGEKASLREAVSESKDSYQLLGCERDKGNFKIFRVLRCYRGPSTPLRFARELSTQDDIQAGIFNFHTR